MVKDVTSIPWHRFDGNGGSLAEKRSTALDDTSWLRPTAHIWTRSKQPWVPLPQDGRNFETQPPGDPWWASVIPAG